MSTDDRTNPDSPRSIEDVINAYFDRELSSTEEAALARRLNRDAGAAMLFGESEAAIDALRLPVDAPDLSGSILTEVGRRRGWLGAKMQRFVAVGRVAIAACILLGLAVTLTARRLAPEAAVFPQASTPISTVTKCASDDTECSFNEIMAAIDEVDASTRLRDVRRAMPSPPNQMSHAGLFSFAADTNHPARMRWKGRDYSAAAHPKQIELTLSIAQDGSFRTLTSQQQVGAIVYIARPAPEAAKSEDDDSTVGGW